MAHSSKWREQEIALFGTQITPGNLALLAIQKCFRGDVVDVFEQTLDASVNFSNERNGFLCKGVSSYP